MIGTFPKLKPIVRSINPIKKNHMPRSSSHKIKVTVHCMTQYKGNSISEYVDEPGMLLRSKRKSFDHLHHHKLDLRYQLVVNHENISN